MNKAAVVARVARRIGLNRCTAEGAVDSVLEAIAESLAKEGDVRIAGLGPRRTLNRAARQGRNSGASEELAISISAG